MDGGDSNLFTLTLKNLLRESVHRENMLLICINPVDMGSNASIRYFIYVMYQYDTHTYAIIIYVMLLSSITWSSGLELDNVTAVKDDVSNDYASTQ